MIDATTPPPAPSPRTPGATAAHRGVRRQKALETRWRIMDAALAEFTERGYHDTTMAAIAERAGVAVQTVYLGFRTKSGLLQELVGNAVLGRTRDGEVGPPEDTDLFARALAEPDGRKALMLWVDMALPVYERTSAISDAGRSAYLSDPEMAEWWSRSESMRLHACVRMAQALADHGSLRSGLSVEEGADVLATTLSPQSFLAYTIDRGWSVDHLGAWLKDALPRLLLDIHR
ncbi:MAG TPA: helix-turn-helix domain-containing protein [Microbacterium sp.]|uniref:TetR/AcrR family transcriptional regulator n=1 Tax=Microbacterium sp. TaxID=51671 RepID=UPI002C3706B8|nr:helix-turn-helix domain-containing protein [Microbacterium sp.]HWI30558.1 helix-turn-helix domain-containing protein [Microbacterium sp.]